MKHCNKCGNNIPDGTTTCEGAGFGDDCGKKLSLNKSKEEIYQLLANTFRNGNHFDYVDWMDADNVTIDGTYDLEELAVGIEALLTTHSQNREAEIRKEVEGMKYDREHSLISALESSRHEDIEYGFNLCKADVMKALTPEQLGTPITNEDKQ